MDKPVCVVVGVGEGNGAALARRFSDDGYATALLARGLDYTTALAAELPDARAYACDVGVQRSVAEAFAAVRRDLGDPAVLAYNAGSGVWGTAEDVTPEQFEAAWRVNALGLLLCAREVIPAMKAKGAGAIVVTGATASRRGGAKAAAFAPAKAAQRSLCESLARLLWPAGVHVALIVVDGIVDLPRTRAAMPDKPADFFVQPDDVAANAAWLSAQPRSAWSFEIEARPFGETW
jgi:NAD(P)-dependent dehydrogenase (short-subunit alcohol dehydrogenase family)